MKTLLKFLRCQNFTDWAVGTGYFDLPKNIRGREQLLAQAEEKLGTCLPAQSADPADRGERRCQGLLTVPPHGNSLSSAGGKN